jgi:hypothetical protein
MGFTHTAVLQVADASGSMALGEHLRDVRAGLDGQVRAPQHRVEVASCRAAALGILLRDLKASKALLLGAVEVIVERQPELDAGLEKGLRHRIDGAQIGDVEWPANAMELRCAALLVFGADEVREHVGVAPAWIAQASPLVVDGTMAPNVDLRVDGAAAADDLAARPIQTASTQVGLRFRLVCPVELALEEAAEGNRDVDLDSIVRSTRLEQQDRPARIGCQTVGQHAPGRACADHDVVVGAVVSSLSRGLGRPDVPAIWDGHSCGHQSRKWPPVWFLG